MGEPGRAKNNVAGLFRLVGRRLFLFGASSLSRLLMAISATANGQTAGHTDSEIEKLMDRLRKGDPQAVGTLAAMGSLSYEPLAKELKRPLNGTSEWLALSALSQLDDKRVILAIAHKHVDLISADHTSGEYDAYVSSYLKAVIGRTFDTFEQYRRWYEEHKDRLIWDKTNQRFRVR